MEAQINLKWTTHKATIFSMFDTLLSTESLVDVTLACDGKFFRAHKVILSACSPYFQEIFGVAGNKPILYLRGVKHTELEALINYMYRGEVSVSHSQLQNILELAKELKIRGLADVPTSPGSSPAHDTNSNVYDSLLNSNLSANLSPVPPELVKVSSPDIGPLSLPPPTHAPASRNPKLPRLLSLEENRAIKLQQRIRPETETLYEPYEQRIPLVNCADLEPNDADAEIAISKRDESRDPLAQEENRWLPRRIARVQKRSKRRDLSAHQCSTFPSPDNMFQRNVLESELRDGLTPGTDAVDLNGIADDVTMIESDTWDTSASNSGVRYPVNSVANSSREGSGEVRSVPTAASILEGINPNYFDEPDPDPIYNRHKRSGVWQHFSVVPSDEGDCELCSQCNYCEKKYKRSTSTTNMKCHLNVSHQIFF